MLRLSNWGATTERIAAHTGRSRISIGRGFDRWELRGFSGLAAGAAPGNPPRITGEARAFPKEKLSGEERIWNATRLAEAVEEHFGVGVTPDAIRQHLLSMGYHWKRTRYVPSRPPDPEEERKARADLRVKRGSKKTSTS